jgi:hypothetical protein
MNPSLEDRARQGRLQPTSTSLESFAAHVTSGGFFPRPDLPMCKMGTGLSFRGSGEGMIRRFTRQEP